MLGSPKKIRRKPSCSAVCCSFDPGSVIAMNLLAASCSPIFCFTRSKKYCLKIFGSRVAPDLLETKNRVWDRSILFSKVLICAGSVESRTCRSGKPAMWPNERRSTSGQRLEPPIPRSNALEKPERFTSSANSLNCAVCRRCSLTMSSQPSHLASSSLVQSEASCAHNRRALPADSHSSSTDASP